MFVDHELSLPETILDWLPQAQGVIVLVVQSMHIPENPNINPAYHLHHVV